MMDTSIVIGTYNRAGNLRRTLQSLKEMSVPPGLDWEIIVVDNNSTDGTRAVVEEFARNSGLRARYLFEPQQGLSHARNRGVKEASGDIIALLDDDVIVTPTWLQEMRNAFDRYGAACVGGKILLHSSIEFPEWWDRRLDPVLGKFDPGDSVIVAGVMEPEHVGIGANISFRKWVFDKYGLFRTDMGRKGARLASGAETEFVQRIRDDRQVAIYYPRARVYHWPKADRFSKSYLRRWFYWIGQWHYQRDVHARRESAKILGVPRWKYRAALESAFRIAVSAVKLDRNEVFFQEVQVLSFAGYFVNAQRERFFPAPRRLPRDDQ